MITLNEFLIYTELHLKDEIHYKVLLKVTFKTFSFTLSFTYYNRVHYVNIEHDDL